eukprot:2049564-Rhodomonas_salina.1
MPQATVTVVTASRSVSQKNGKKNPKIKAFVVAEPLVKGFLLQNVREVEGLVVGWHRFKGKPKCRSESRLNPVLAGPVHCRACSQKLHIAHTCDKRKKLNGNCDSPPPPRKKAKSQSSPKDEKPEMAKSLAPSLSASPHAGEKRERSAAEQESPGNGYAANHHTAEPNGAPRQRSATVRLATPGEVAKLPSLRVVLATSTDEAKNHSKKLKMEDGSMVEVAQPVFGSRLLLIMCCCLGLAYVLSRCPGLVYCPPRAVRH